MNGPRAGQKAGRRILGIQTYLYCVTKQINVFLRYGQRFTAGNPQLPLDKVITRNEFSNRMLYLQAGVHFQEKKLSVSIKQKLHRTRSNVVDSACGLHSGGTHCGS